MKSLLLSLVRLVRRISVCLSVEVPAFIYWTIAMPTSYFDNLSVQTLIGLVVCLIHCFWAGAVAI